MQSTKKQKTEKPPVNEAPLEEQLAFDFSEFLNTADAFSCLLTILDLLLYRPDHVPLTENEQIDLREITYFLRKIHNKTYQKVEAAA